MKHLIYILSITLGLCSCSSNPQNPSDNKPLTTLNTEPHKDTASSISSQEKTPLEKRPAPESSKDSVIFFPSASFRELDLALKDISESVFQAHQTAYQPTCPLDTNGFIQGKGLVLDHHCKDICQTHLADKKARIKIMIPSDYDQGILGLHMSPSCNQFLVYSSYDGPDYENYYEYRAEIIGFKITGAQGFKAIQPSFSYHTKNWSIEDVTWITDNTIAIKTYEGARSEAKDKRQFRCFKTQIE